MIAFALAILVATLQSATLGAAEQPPPNRPWMDAHLDSDSRSRLLLAAMTENEKLALIFGYFSTDAPWKNFKKPGDGLEQSAGYIGGSARLGIPALLETDAGIGSRASRGPIPACAPPCRPILRSRPVGTPTWRMPAAA
jgi:beta-glucosidase